MVRRLIVEFFVLVVLLVLSGCCFGEVVVGGREEISMEVLRAGFSEPDMKYGPSAFWFWDRGVDEELVAEMTAEMCRQGMNPGYVQGRSGLPREQWLSDEWFECFGKAAEIAEENKCYIGYVDEYDCPSGQALGRVLAKHPELKGVSLKWKVRDVKGPVEVELEDAFFTVAARRVEPFDSNGWPVKIDSDSIELISPGQGKYSVAEGCWRIYSFSKSFHRGISGGSVNYIDRRLPGAFIELAHEGYAEHFKEKLGKTVAGVFVDNEGDYGWKLAWSDDLEKEFKQKNGVDIREVLVLMIDEDVQGKFAKWRWCWYEAVSDIFCESFLGEVNRWVKEHGMYTISNLWESNWDLYKKYESLCFQAFATGDFFKAQRSVSMPGNDCLIDKYGQVYEFKETQSVCEFEGRRFMSEVLGVAGWQMTPLTMKKAANCVVAFGVNNVVAHGVSLQRKLTKIPYPPDWFEANPYWLYFHLWSDFVRRASYVNSHGQLAADVLLVNPMDSVWVLYGGGVFDMGHDSFSPEHSGNQQRLRKIEKVYYDAVNELQDGRVEYLIADRYYLRNMELKDGGVLCYKGFEFKAVVLPDLVILPMDVAKKILDFAKKGGRVYCLGELPGGSSDKGLYDPEMRAMMAELEGLASFTKTDKGIKGLLAGKDDGLRSHIEFEKGGFEMIQQHRVIEGKDFFWLANNTGQRKDCVLNVRGVKGGAAIWDCESGEIRDVEVKCGGVVEVGFGPYEAYWLVFGGAESGRPVLGRKGDFKKNIVLEGGWEVRVDVNDQPVAVADDQEMNVPGCFLGEKGQIKELGGWDEWGLGMFSGFVDYVKFFDYDGSGREVIVDLGKVNYMAELWINGKKVGEKMWPEFEFDITGYVKKGRNKMFVRVGNTLYSTMRQYVGKNTGQSLWGWIGVKDEEKISGLFGPVVLRIR